MAIRSEADMAPARGLELWEPTAVGALEAQLGREVTDLFTGPRADLLYVHPVKLSRWRVPDA